MFYELFRLFVNISCQSCVDLIAAAKQLISVNLEIPAAFVNSIVDKVILRLDHIVSENAFLVDCGVILFLRDPAVIQHKLQHRITPPNGLFHIEMRGVP